MADEAKIDNPDDFARWLEGRPAAWAQMLAARVALRVLPLAADGWATGRRIDDWPAHMILAVFRASLISWAVRKYPALDMRAAATAANFAANSIAYSAANSAASSAASSAVYSATKSAFHFYSAATSAAAANSGANAAAADAADAAGAAASAAAAAASAAADSAADADAAIWSALARDCTWLEVNSDGRLADQGLWLEEGREEARTVAGLPVWARGAWDRFVGSALASEHGFGPWIDWYNGVIYNGFIANDAAGPWHDYLGESVTVKIATQPNEWWDRPAAEVNADIAGWLGEPAYPASPIAGSETDAEAGNPDADFEQDLEGGNEKDPDGKISNEGLLTGENDISLEANVFPAIDQSTVRRVISNRAVLAYQASNLHEFLSDLIGPDNVPPEQRNSPPLAEALGLEDALSDGELLSALHELRDELKRFNDALENNELDVEKLGRLREAGLTFTKYFVPVVAIGAAGIAVTGVGALLDQTGLVPWSKVIEFIRAVRG